jgi:hypothetical protein
LWQVRHDLIAWRLAFVGNGEASRRRGTRRRMCRRDFREHRDAAIIAVLKATRIWPSQLAQTRYDPDDPVGQVSSQTLSRTVALPLLRTVWIPLLPSPSVPVRAPHRPRARHARTHSGRASVLLGGSVRTVRTVGAHRRLFHGRPRTGRAAACSGLTGTAQWKPRRQGGAVVSRLV